MWVRLGKAAPYGRDRRQEQTAGARARMVQLATLRDKPQDALGETILEATSGGPELLRSATFNPERIDLEQNLPTA